MAVLRIEPFSSLSDLSGDLRPVGVEMFLLDFLSHPQGTRRRRVYVPGRSEAYVGDKDTPETILTALATFLPGHRSGTEETESKCPSQQCSPRARKLDGPESSLNDDRQDGSETGPTVVDEPWTIDGTTKPSATFKETQTRNAHPSKQKQSPGCPERYRSYRRLHGERKRPWGRFRAWLAQALSPERQKTR